MVLRARGGERAGYSTLAYGQKMISICVDHIAGLSLLMETFDETRLESDASLTRNKVGYERQFYAGFLC